MIGSATGARARERVTQISESSGDAPTMREELLDEIRRAVPADAFAWLLTDPETCVGWAPLAEVPCLPELPRLIRLKYLTEENRWTQLTSPALLRATTHGEPSRSLLWRGLLMSYGVVDVASMVFRDQFGCWGFLDLWRMSPSEGFTAAEADYLTAISAPITLALRRNQASRFASAPGSDSSRRGPVVLLLDDDLEVLAQTPETEAYLRLLVPPDGPGPAIPASAYNVAAQLLAREHGVDANPAVVRSHLSGGRWLTLRAARIPGAKRPERGQIAVTIEDSSSSERASLFALAHGLSGREKELLAQLVDGADTRELARRLQLSQHTVQDHLKSIFTKTSVHDRRTLMSRALGT